MSVCRAPIQFSYMYLFQTQVPTRSLSKFPQKQGKLDSMDFFRNLLFFFLLLLLILWLCISRFAHFICFEKDHFLTFQIKKDL